MVKIANIYKNIFLVDVGHPELPQTFGCYIIVGDRIMIIDPGPTKFFNSLLSAFDELGLNKGDVAYIALTHIHPDHYGAASKLVNHFPNAKILVHPKGKPHIVNPQKLWDSAVEVLGEVVNYIGKPDPMDENRIREVKDYEIISLSDDICVLALFTPGHASHHISYFTDWGNIMFAGDSAGLCMDGYLAPTTPQPFELEAALESIHKMLLLRPDHIAYIHFGMYGNGFRKLIEYYGQLNLWKNMITKLYKEGRRGEELLDMLLRVDHNAREFLDKIKENPFLSDGVHRSLHGFLSYLRKSGVID